MEIWRAETVPPSKGKVRVMVVNRQWVKEPFRTDLNEKVINFTDDSEEWVLDQLVMRELENGGGHRWITFSDVEYLTLEGYARHIVEPLKVNTVAYFLNLILGSMRSRNGKSIQVKLISEKGPDVLVKDHLTEPFLVAIEILE